MVLIRRLQVNTRRFASFRAADLDRRIRSIFI
jgi:hypothetical protein